MFCQRTSRKGVRWILVSLIFTLVFTTDRFTIEGFGDEQYRSHPPLRVQPPASKRAFSDGPTCFVDAAKGNDDNDGSLESPWKTVSHALEHLSAGDTLCLRGGVYYENVVVSLVGRQDAPITIRSYPGEQAILDGGIPQFFEQAATAWQPYDGGAAGEYRSTRRYPNGRNVVGCFGDSMIGLQTYYHATDLRATNEIVEPNAEGTDVKPLYCGPGLWYDRTSGHLHARLRHTHLPGVDNYQGETDPRKLPLVIAPYRSVPLHVDRAEHVHFQDLVVRGGGYNTVVLEQASDVAFDNVTVWCGTYGLRAIGLQRLTFFRSALYGGIAPWTTRFESGFNTYPGRTTRNITRLNTHALLVADANREFSVSRYPFNEDWEIAYSEFSEGADGLYLGGVGLSFHHNIVTNTHDDGIYLSPMYERHTIFGGGATMHIYQNQFSRCLTMLAFGGRAENHDTVFFYRNIVDMRAPILTGRPRPKSPSVSVSTGKVTGDHGGPPWSAMNTYHNTFVVNSKVANAPDLWMARGAAEGRPRNVFNNVFLNLNRMNNLRRNGFPHLQIDANLYWHPGLQPQQIASYFTKFRQSPVFEQSQTVYPPGYDANSIVADPRFLSFSADPNAVNDYRPQPGSPLINAGVELPQDWPDPLRSHDKGRPDIGALPRGAELWTVGRTGGMR